MTVLVAGLVVLFGMQYRTLNKGVVNHHLVIGFSPMRRPEFLTMIGQRDRKKEVLKNEISISIL
jgi:hypothetical protein